MFEEKSRRQRAANVHNDFIIDQLETEGDYRALLDLVDRSTQLGKIIFLPTSYSDAEQRERRLDLAALGEVLNEHGKAIGERIYLVEFKSVIRKTELLVQILSYIAILWARYEKPVTAAVVYTGKRRLKQNGCLSFREHMRSKHPAINEQDLDFPISLLDTFTLNPVGTQGMVEPIAPGLYLAPRIYDLKEEEVAEFFHLCAQLAEDQRERRLEKGCIFIVRYGRGYDWDRLVRIEQRTLPEKEWLVGRVQFSREAYGREQHQQGLDEGRAEGQAKGRAEGEAKGRAEGEAESRAQIAMRMLEGGEPDDKVSRMTGMSKKELELLKRGLRAKNKL